MDFVNSSGIRSPFSPRVQQTMDKRIGKNRPGKSLHGDSEQRGEIIYKSPQMTVESVGASLPVMVTEALAFSVVSVRMSDIGWCWCVSGRRVLCCKLSGGSVRELLLPQTDLAHRADLIMLCGDPQMPSCIGVSPEGVIRFWPSIAQESTFVETSCDLQGQECLRLNAGAEEGWLLGTTSGALLAVVREGLSVTVLRPAGGRRQGLVGLGRRVSQIFFQSTQTLETRLVGIAVLVGGLVALVSRGGALQLWREHDLREHDLRRALPPELADLECTDVRESGDYGFILLMTSSTSDQRYALVEISVENCNSPTVLSLWSGVGTPGQGLRAIPLGGAALLYGQSCLLLLHGIAPNDKVEVLNLANEGDRILCAEIVDGNVLLFSAKHGITRLTFQTQHRSLCEAPMAVPSVADIYDGNLSFYEIDPREVDAVTTDACGKLKVAFLYHVRRDVPSCRRLLNELFPNDGDDRHNERAFTDTVLAIARDILDDVPAGDPRWARLRDTGSGISLGSSGALRITHQLMDKNRALVLLHDFLRCRARSYTTERGWAMVEREMGALAEMLAAALALAEERRGPAGHVVDAAIAQVQTAAPDEGLSAADVCLCAVTGVGAVLSALPLMTATHDVMTVIASVVSAASECWSRRSARPSCGALVEPLHNLYREFFAVGLSRVECPTARASCLRHAEVLCRYLLSSAELDPGRTAELIRPFAAEGQHERAASLAEEAKLFDFIVQMYIGVEDYEKLYAYIDKYPDERLAQSAFSYLSTRRGDDWVRLVTRVGERYRQELCAWLDAVTAPAVTSSHALALHALHALHCSDHSRAAAALLRVAGTERRAGDLRRLTTASSLGKLCALAAEERGAARSLSRCLTLAAAHRAMPAAVRPQALQYVHDPEELLRLYLETDLTAAEFLRALKLSRAIEDMDSRDELVLQLWCKSILQEDWSECRADNPEKEVTTKLFFRIVDELRLMGSLDKYLPPLEDLMTSPSLADALDDAARYVITYGYKMATGDA